MTTFRFRAGRAGGAAPVRQGGLPRDNLAKMRMAVLLLVLPEGAVAESVVTPGGLTVDMYAVIIEPDTGMARFRFLYPDLGALAPEAAFPDMQWLCDQVALAEVQAMGAAPQQIIITLSDRVVEQGMSDPDALQYFEGYNIATGACVWEPF
jgi:hypothetical protein